jgi:hypothetical protein
MNTQRLINIYFGSFVLMVLAWAWTSTGYLGLFVENIEGGMQRFQRMVCQSDLDPSCGQVSFSRVGSKVLLGDSEAMSIADQYKKRFDRNAYVYAENGCSFLPETINRTRTNQCIEFNKLLLQKLNKECVADLYLFNRFVPKNNFEKNQYLSFLKQLNISCKRLIVIGTPLQIIGNYSAYASLFFSKSLDSPKSFSKGDFMNEYMEWNKEISSRLTDILYIDTEKLLVSSFPTELTNNSGQYLYTDSTHVSKYGAEIISQSLP